MILTFLRHGSNAVITLALAGAVVAFAAGWVTFSLTAALIGAAVFFVSEYTTHRFLFHAPPSKIPWLLKMQHRLHYDHHIDPPKLDLLFLPLWFVVPTTVLYYGLYYAVARNTGIALSLAFGSICALYYYEWVHYVAHIPFTPKTSFGRYVKKYHLWHHYKNEHFWYGVTNPSMDFVGVTYRDQSVVERSTSVREIWRSM